MGSLLAFVAFSAESARWVFIKKSDIFSMKNEK